MLQSGRIRNPRLQGDNPLFRSKLATIRSGYYQKFNSKNTPPLPELKAKLKNRLELKRNSKYLGKFYQKFYFIKRFFFKNSVFINFFIKRQRKNV